MNHPAFLYILLSSALLNSFFSYIIPLTNSQKICQILAFLGVTANLSILAFFKYSTLIYNTFFTLNSFGEWLITLPLPIGISFYSFQGISLLIDVFKKDKKLNPFIKTSFLKHTLNTVFFISFFPHSIAGPIVKAHTFLPQIKTKHFKNIHFEYVFKVLIIGYFFKTVIADNLHDYTFWMQYPYFESFSSPTLVILLFAYSAQIFADFAGYSLIAIGIAALFGYQLPQNFNFPYISSSFSEFWTRWHMSLSSWLKEYLYLPLGGNRRGNIRTYINLMIVMILGGFWHGAGWNYLFWGALHGTVLVFERFLSNFTLPYKNLLLFKSFKIVTVFIIVSWAWLFFKIPSFDHAFLYTKTILVPQSSHLPKDIVKYCVIYSIPVFLYHLTYCFNLTKKTITKPFYLYSLYAIMLFLIISNGGSSNAFIYFQF